MTILKVAERAGVSPSTVSRILNGTASVSPAKRAAVVEAVAALGFVPNPIARGLAGGRSMSIGVLTQAIDSPFYGSMLRGIEDALRPVGYSPLFVSGDWNVKLEAHGIAVLHSRRVDGVIVLTGRLSNKALLEYAAQLPIVVTGRNLAPQLKSLGPKAPQIVALNFDNHQGAMLATEHLLSLGHRAIACIAGDKNHPDGIERYRGYCDALQRAGLALNKDLVVWGDYHENSGLEALNALLARGLPFSAIFAANDQMAIGAALGLHRRGLLVPQDISLVGFDDLPTAPYTIPPLSTVRQPAYEMGTIAAQAMLALLNGNTPDCAFPAPKLITRDSTRSLQS